MKKLNKNILGWVIVSFFSLIVVSYGASGTIGNLFYLISGTENGVTITNEYRLNGKNIEDETITSHELASNSVGASELNSLDSFDMNALNVVTTVTASQYNLSSDIRYKKDIKLLNNSLEKVLRLNGYSYSLKNGGKRDIGIIAQEVEKVFPELVHTNQNDGYKSVQYINLIAVLIEAIKEQQKQINLLEKSLKSK